MKSDFNEFNDFQDKIELLLTADVEIEKQEQG